MPQLKKYWCPKCKKAVNFYHYLKCSIKKVGGVEMKVFVVVVVNWDYEEIEDVDVYKDWKTLRKAIKNNYGIDVGKSNDVEYEIPEDEDYESGRIIHIEEFNL